MSIKTKRQALDSIHKRTRILGGKPFDSFVCYVGTDPVEHKKIMFERTTKEAVANDVNEFFDVVGRGSSPALARQLSARDFAEFSLVRAMLSDAGISSMSLVSIVQDYINRQGRTIRCTLGEALQKYLDSFSEVQIVHRQCIANRVGQFVRTLGPGRIASEVTALDISNYADKHLSGVAPKTWNNHIQYIKSFFSWMCRKDIGYCIDNPASDIRAKQIAYKEPEFVTAETVRDLFSAACGVEDPHRRAELISFLALSFFNGVRADEIFRLGSQDVNIEEGWVRVAMPKGFSRGIAPRMVPLTDTAKKWLVFAAGAMRKPPTSTAFIAGMANGSVALKTVFRIDPSLVKRLPHNAGRHSFITMHVALHGNPTETEAICGTSKQMRTKNYMGLATRKQAEDYFAVLPPAKID